MKLTEVQIAHVKSLENERGQLTASLVLADAKSTDSPLHSLFDWDKEKAAEAWWLDCAREIIRTVVVVIKTEHVTLKAPLYVHNPNAKGQGYRSVMSMRQDVASAREALINELTRAAGNLARARALAVALNLTDDLDELMERITGLRSRVDLLYGLSGDTPSEPLHQ